MIVYNIAGLGPQTTQQIKPMGGRMYCRLWVAADCRS